MVSVLALSVTFGATSPKERGKGVPFITPQCLSAVCSAPPICRPVFFPEKTFV